MQALQSHIFAVREYLSPVLKESKFKEHGRITPEEFVAAGDFLVYKFPVWSWEAGDKSKVRDFLPPNKQYLVTRGVPCLRRATSLAYTDEDGDAERLVSFKDPTAPPTSKPYKSAAGSSSAAGGDDDDEWVETHAGRKSTLPTLQGDTALDEIPDVGDDDDDDDSTRGIGSSLGGLRLGGSSGGAGGGASANVPATPDLDDIPDMEEDLEEDDEATATTKTNTVPAKTVDEGKASAPSPPNPNVLQVRTYDVMITYDKYYQTPRVWLIGYDESGKPLTPNQIFEDISADHAQKTVTIEPFIHSGSLQAASVHPCKHASVMKKVIERMNNSVVVEKLGGSTGASVKDKEKEKKKWLFGRKSASPTSSRSAASKAGGRTTSSGKPGSHAAGASSTDVEEEEIEGMRVDFYLVVFLKFIASIVPTIEVDSTASF